MKDVIEKLDQDLQLKYNHLKEIISNSGKVIIALSGGVDSSLLAKVSFDLLAEKALAVIGLSPSLPEREKEDALNLAKEIGIAIKTIQTNELENEDYKKNQGDRCYYCKSELYKEIHKLREELSFDTILDGTNFSDIGGHRPGFRATEELFIKKPLLEAKFTKDDVRKLARELGLSNWDKPAFACLSSRFPKGIMISTVDLGRVEKGEDILFQQGFKQFRLRFYNDLVRIEVSEDELHRFSYSSLRKKIVKSLKDLGFNYVTVDLEGYKQGNIS